MMSSCTLTSLVVSKSLKPVMHPHTHRKTLEWASGDLGAVIEWDYGTSDGVAYHEFHRESQTEITETRELPNWGTFYWSTADADNVSNLNRTSPLASSLALSVDCFVPHDY